MTDQQHDIDIEAEKAAWELWTEQAGLTTPRDHEYEMMRFAWLARARLAAEREREILDLLREAADFVHLECLGKYGKAGHTDLCRKITEALKPKGPSE